MGFLDSVKDALRGAVTGQASKVQTAEKEAARRDDVREPDDAKAAKLETYTVKTGDSLPEIGARFGVPHLEIAQLNNIENPDLIFPGQVFRIPKS